MQIAVQATEVAVVLGWADKAHKNLIEVAHPLPEYTSSSEAMQAFRALSLSSKNLFKSYRELFDNDTTAVKNAIAKLQDSDAQIGASIKGGAC